MSRWGKSGGRRALRPVALLASAIFHAALLVLLVRYLAPPPVYDEPPSIQVSLVPPLRSERAPRDADPARSDHRGALAQTEPALPIQPLPPWPPNGGAAPSTPSGAAPGEAEGAAKGLLALRGLRGCDLARLTPQDRERCEAERWARVAPVTARLNLDPTGRYAKNPEPFLSRRPKDGCRARLTGDVDPMGNDMNARAGVTCVVPF